MGPVELGKGINVAKQPSKGRKTPAKPRAAKPKASAPNKATTTDKSAPAKVAETKVVDAKAVDLPKVDAPNEPPKPEEPVKTSEKPSNAAAGSEPDAGSPPTPPKPATDPTPAQTRQGSGFIPLLLGGLVAGGIGYAAAYVTQPRIDPLLASKVSTQAKTIADLQDQIANIPVVDTARLDQADTATTALAGRVDDLDGRLSDLMTQPAADGSLTAANIAAYQQELEDLRTSVADLRGTAVAELEAARATAASIEQNAEAAARAAAGRAALARVKGAIETGAPMGALLDELAQALQSDAPAALVVVRDGTPTLASLQADFPDAARDALRTARAEGVSGESEGGITSFLRNQFSVRSTAPQEGDTVDAILSRAQAAVSNGRLTDALSEVSTLPEVARAPLTDWVGRAEIRVDAQAAAATLTEQLNAN